MSLIGSKKSSKDQSHLHKVSGHVSTLVLPTDTDKCGHRNQSDIVGMRISGTALGPPNYMYIISYVL